MFVFSNWQHTFVCAGKRVAADRMLQSVEILTGRSCKLHRQLLSRRRNLRLVPVYYHFSTSPRQIGMKTTRLNSPAPTSVGDLQSEGKADQSNQTIFTLASIISHLTQVTSFSQPDALLRFAAKNIPGLIGSAGCSIYLRPDLALKYDGLLQDENQQPIQARDISDEFVVLSASTRPDLEALIGKAFYPVDRGLSGRVLGQGLPLRLRNYTDLQEQLAVAPGLHWQDRYGDEKHYRYTGGCRPLLIVPLTAKAGALGFIVFPATLDNKPFTRLAEEIAVIAAQNLANALERTWYIREQDRHIRHLVDIGAKHQLGEIYEAVTQRLGSMLNARECQLYVRIDGGSGAQLAAEDGRILEAGTGKTYRPGQDVIGWVFKTGFPLLIPDTDEFTRDDDACMVDLERLLLGARLNSEDGILKCDQPLPGPTSLLVIPVQNHNGLVLGVLSLPSHAKNPVSAGTPVRPRRPSCGIIVCRNDRPGD